MSYVAVSLGLPFAALSSVAYAVSGDGSVVVGLIFNANFTISAVLWDASNVAHILPGLGATSPADGATGITEDGTIAVGYSRNSGGLHHAVYWTGGPTWASPVVHDLGVLPGASDNESFALGCSSNASLIVGFSEIGGGVSDSSACVWSDFGAPAAIPAGPTGNAAITCSPDGAVIVGGTAAFSRNVTPASQWTDGPSWALTPLGDLAGSVGPSAATGCTGSLTVGYVSDASGNTYAGTWTGTDFTEFSTPAGGSGSQALGCDPSGVYVVGSSSSATATLWTSGAGQTLPLFSGATNVFSATAISSDLSTIVGTGADADNNAVAVKWTIQVSTEDVTVADLFFSVTTSFVDFTLVGNRRRFIAINGGAQNLQPDGSGPYAVAPVVFLSLEGSNAPNTFAQNYGRGGTFNKFGPDLTDGASNPPSVTATLQTPSDVVPFSAVLGDYLTGNIYAFNPNTLTDNGQQRKWLRRWRALPDDTTSSITFSYLSIDMETGIQVPPGTNPQLVLRWSDDGGHTWSGGRIIPVGVTGETAFTVKFNRLGSTARFSGSTRIFELSSTDPFKVSIMRAEVLTK